MAADSTGREIFLEVPDFGFGPAATILAAIRGVLGQYKWVVISSGNSAAFLRRELPYARHYELNTWDTSQWSACIELMPRHSIVISSGNPPFAAWAIRNGYRVGHLDALDWMWVEKTDELADAEFNLAPAYYGAPSRFSSDTREIVRPLVDTDIWARASEPTQPGTALIAFGGMRLPGHDELVAKYVRWVLDSGLPPLIEHRSYTQVTIVGGRADLARLVPAHWREHPAVQTLPGMTRRDYAAIVGQSHFLLLSPGLATIYECYVSGALPVYQPGYNFSMILQLRDLVAVGYPNAVAWPWHEHFIGSVHGIPEADGLRLLAARILETIRADPAGTLLSDALYGQDDWSSGSAPSDLARLWDFPDGAALTAHHLRRLTA